ncbi:MAG: hypothetical protein Q9227_002723 [Pyrenula ochraceoflavens]
MNKTTAELSNQWANPGDILSLLLLIGGDIVQKAIAQLTGYSVRPLGAATPGLSIAPVAFSFGWAAYAFSNLLAMVGDMRLMPMSESPALLVNCSNGFVRETRSWVLGRLLRDHEAKYEVDARSKSEGGRDESIRIDIFNLGSASTPVLDLIWWSGWFIILVQFGVAIVPWVLYDDWGILLVTLCGNFLAAVTCAMPQWQQEKCTGRKLRYDKVTCLTRGNGHAHIMVFIGAPGSWDMERLATRNTAPQAETRWFSLALAVLWTCLLISVSGLRNHAWFLVGIGGVGMLQNVFAAGVPREPGASNFHLTDFSRSPVILGKREYQEDDEDANVNLEESVQQLTDVSVWVSEKTTLSRLHTTNARPYEIHSMPPWLVSMSKQYGVPNWLEPLKPAQMDQSSSNPSPPSYSVMSSIWKTLRTDKNDANNITYAVGVQGALIELEKWVPTAGLAMLQIFFPGTLKYSDESVRDNMPKKFWQRAYHTRSVRKRAEEKRRAMERNDKARTHT